MGLPSVSRSLAANPMADGRQVTLSLELFRGDDSGITSMPSLYLRPISSSTCIPLYRHSKQLIRHFFPEGCL